MTHEEIAKRIVEKFYNQAFGYDEQWPEEQDETMTAWENEIITALASAEKKGREEGKNLLKACESAQHSIWKRVDDAYEDGWNDAILAARKVAEEHKSTDGECPESIANAEGYRTAVSQIAESINKLRKE